MFVSFGLKYNASVHVYNLRSSHNGPSLEPHWKPWTILSFTELSRPLSTYNYNDNKNLENWGKTMPRSSNMNIETHNRRMQYSVVNDHSMTTKT